MVGGIRPAAGVAGAPAPGVEPIPIESSTLGEGMFQLFAQSDLNFQTLIALGGAGINSAVGEVTTAVAQANAAEGGASYQSVFDAMVATGDRLRRAADEAAKAKHVITARAVSPGCAVLQPGAVLGARHVDA